MRFRAWRSSADGRQPVLWVAQSVTAASQRGGDTQGQRDRRHHQRRWFGNSGSLCNLREVNLEDLAGRARL